MQCSKEVCERGTMTVYHKRLGVSFLSKMLYSKHGFGPRDRVSKYYTADKCFNPFYVDSVIYYLYFIAVYGLHSCIV